MKLSTLVSAIGVIAGASAQQIIYGQCGGINWTGPTTCVSGSYCSYDNPYYSQCVPGTASGSVTSTITSTKATTTGTTTATTTSTTTSSAASGTSTISGYARVSGSVFVIDEKETYFMGTNCYWCGFLTDNADVDTVFSHIAASGLKVVRVWGFNDITSAASSGTVWYQSFIEGESVQINTGADGLERLDVVVSTAESYGVSLIVNFVNNWDNYGGMQAYADYYDINLLDWYNSTVAQAQYQTYIEAVVSRYKTSTAIFAWELANEPRCTPGCDLSTIQTWATQTSAYIKSLDPNHMVTLGDEGFGLNTDSDGSYPFSTTAGGYNWTQNLAIPDIDFGTYHLYPSSWGEEDSWGPLWIEAHATAAAQVGKPVIAEEYGSLTITDELPWQAEVLATNTAGDMWWQYGDTLSTGETSNDGYAIYYGTALYEQMVIPHAEAMNAKAV